MIIICICDISDKEMNLSNCCSNNLVKNTHTHTHNTRILEQNDDKEKSKGEIEKEKDVQILLYTDTLNTHL